MEPESFEAAVKEKEWVKAMEEEIRMIEKNKTWELVDPPNNKEVIGVKCVYKTKLNPDGSIQKHKARLVAKGRIHIPKPDWKPTVSNGQKTRYHVRDKSIVEIHAKSEPSSLWSREKNTAIFAGY
ncbi:Uncharacterized mitochondrial protein AtMg00820 [Striga hermonthica]|uniref:Uncharacterized mitochondrial protein AtMg00820 n=1 Tax=Striga hermonthica TaxID=68872 RepID=A0A9N7R4V4_STRHE|nr:Uncharacterized mitochondrial protein AtMg00820 [Striga hermonthica]